jgi:hypothetical protein
VLGREALGLAVSGQGGATSATVFRGQTLYDGVSAQGIVRPRYSFGSLGAVHGSVWAMAPLQGDTAEEQYFSIAPSLSYEVTYSRFTFSVGHNWYVYPRTSSQRNSTAEISAGMTLDTVLNPTVTVYRDYDSFDSEYFELSLRHTFLRSDAGGFNVTLFSTIGFASNASQRYDHGGLVQITSGVTTDVRVAGACLRPFGMYTGSEDGAVDNRVWGGVQVAFGGCAG